jgi:SpoVK/Ycf46/Vps4 family AAA+-type ATPase
VNVLLCGGSGTGKTTACEVLAAELGRILLVMDVAHVVSKYIGETEKRLAEVFDIAERSGAVLVVDEADALFGKRTPVTDAHDRYANREVSYLLQRMENYRGILVLTTNLQTNIDQAFARRLQFVIELTFPDERQRERIWQLTLPARAAIDPDVNPATLAATYPLAGGHIRSIAVGAAIFAVTAGEPIAMRHVAAAARRELQKLGRSVPDSSYPPAVPR